MARFDLTDAESAVIETVLPADTRGVERVDDRRVLNGIYWRLRTGAPWADIPARYAPQTACGHRFRYWRKARVWDRRRDAVSKASDGDIRMTDSTSVRVHQHFATAKQRRPIRLHGSPHPEALEGRGGLTTMIPALVEAEGRPIALKQTGGQAHDSRSTDDMHGAIGPGQTLLGHLNYDSDERRDRLAKQGA